jgi:hypothetical protein
MWLLIQLTLEEWTLIAAVAGVILTAASILVSVFLHRSARHQKATVWIVQLERGPGTVPEIGIAIRNDGEPDLVLAQPAKFAIGNTIVDSIAPHRFTFGRSGFGANEFPVRMQTDDEITSYIPRSQLADGLWMLYCFESCGIRGIYQTTQGRRLQTPVFDAPVAEWLPADASARQIKPRT